MKITQYRLFMQEKKRRSKRPKHRESRSDRVPPLIVMPSEKSALVHFKPQASRERGSQYQNPKSAATKRAFHHHQVVMNLNFCTLPG